ncbi:hypothetical protein [Rufibacter sp. LB8]|uniref:hypothetical protein n=1 Tax=Rufibacter sp. LB8 TaxID=2777781 RepID=UPI00178C6B6C|nr:hypothetical protein [Rufibacter sp. LB8]
MKKALILLAVAGMTSLAACDAKTGGNVGGAQGDPNAEQLGGSTSPEAVPNDTTGTAATEKTQTNVGNSDTRGERNNSTSRTTQNQVVKDSTNQ